MVINRFYTIPEVNTRLEAPVNNNSRNRRSTPRTDLKLTFKIRYESKYLRAMKGSTNPRIIPEPTLKIV